MGDSGGHSVSWLVVLHVDDAVWEGSSLSTWVGCVSPCVVFVEGNFMVWQPEIEARCLNL